VCVKVITIRPDSPSSNFATSAEGPFGNIDTVPRRNSSPAGVFFYRRFFDFV